jgi:hypothetical protein
MNYKKDNYDYRSVPNVRRWVVILFRRNTRSKLRVEYNAECLSTVKNLVKEQFGNWEVVRII